MCFIQTSCLFTLFVIIFLTLYLTSSANINRKKILRPYWLLDISSRIKEQRVHYRKKKEVKRMNFLWNQLISLNSTMFELITCYIDILRDEWWWPFLSWSCIWFWNVLKYSKPEKNRVCCYLIIVHILKLYTGLYSPLVSFPILHLQTTSRRLEFA